MVSRADLMKQLEALGVPQDRPVAAHTSLRAVGETEGGGEGFLDALICWVTRDRTAAFSVSRRTPGLPSAERIP